MDIETRITHLEAHCARGWLVFPVNGKVPATRAGKPGTQTGGLYAGTSDIVRWRTQWQQRPDWNIGINCGDSGLVVIDCDLDKENPTSWAGPFDDDGVDIDIRPALPGISVFLEMCDANDHDPEDTYCVTTPSGGLHAYYRMREDQWVPSSRGCVDTEGYVRRRKQPTRIDVRAYGGFVVATGSDIDGVEYEHCGGPEPLELPDWLNELIIPPPATLDSLTSRSNVERWDAKTFKNSDVKWLDLMIQDVERAVMGSRNDVLRDKMWRCLLAGGEERHVDALCLAGERAGLSEGEVGRMKRHTMRGF